MDNDLAHSNVIKLKEDFYSSEKKKTFLGVNSQKMQCAKFITENISIECLLQQTFYVVSGTNKIYLNYPMFKMFANTDNYNEIVNYLFQLFNTIIQQCGNFEIHMNLQSFSISAAERYRDCFELFSNICTQYNTEYSILLVKLHIYYAPSFIEQLYKMFHKLIDPRVKPLIVIHNKEESGELLQSVLGVGVADNVSPP
jgi:hypothetical protein